jgi:hypothetical protein
MSDAMMNKVLDRLVELEARLRHLETVEARVVDLSGYLPLAGGTMTGDLELAADPNLDMEAATKQYVDGLISSGLSGLPMLLPMALVSGLRAYWMANVYDGVNVYDTSGAARHLSITGTLVQGMQATGVQYLTLDGTNDRLYRADEDGLDVLTGLGFMAWVRFTHLSADTAVVNKWNAGTDTRSYQLQVQTDGDVRFRISSDGTAGTIANVVAGTQVSLGTWHCLQARYVASTGIYVRIDDNAWTSNLTSIPASLFNNNRTLYLGELDENAANRMDGDLACAWIAGHSLTDYQMFDRIYEAQAPLFA